MTCVDTTMLSSVMQDATAQYIATTLFAVTLVVAGALRTLWRRRPWQKVPEEPASAPESLSSSSARTILGTGRRARRRHLQRVSSCGRRKESS